MDIVPTVLDLTRSAAARSTPETGSAKASLAPMGQSWATLLRGSRPDRLTERQLNWELFYQRAARKGRYKAVWLTLPDQAAPQLRSALQASHATGRWQLFDLAADPGETRDISAIEPKILKSLVAQWNDYARQVGILMQ